MDSREAAQVDEVVARLRSVKEATLVHVLTGHEVDIYLDRKDPPPDPPANWPAT